MSHLHGLVIGFALTGSHCTLPEVLPQVRLLREAGAEVVPILSPSVSTMHTRFGSPEDWRRALREIAGRNPLETIPEVEPLGPQKKLDALVVAPCTGNTLARIANALTDTPVAMAVKSTLRNGRPVVLAISTNDGLGLNAPNWARLMAVKNIYFVPFGQDNPYEKPNSLVAHLDLLLPTLEQALEGKQYQPVLISWREEASPARRRMGSWQA